MANLCIIPARGGSKRIPRKNIKPFLGKPIISYSIETAIESHLFDEVMVSTDDEEIAKIAKLHGANVPFFRSGENANDFATLADVVDEVKMEYLKLGIQYNYICCILPTCPLITIESLKKGLSLIIENKADSIRPIVRFSYPIQRAFRQNGDFSIEMLYPEFLKTRSQDLEPAFHDAGQFYWMDFNKALRGINKIGFEIPEISTQDIDTDSDWQLTELKYKLLK